MGTKNNIYRVTKGEEISNIHCPRAMKKNEGHVRKWEVELEVRRA